MNRATNRARQKARARLKVGLDGPLEVVPVADWPTDVAAPPGLQRILQNGRFVVLECRRDLGITLLMVQRVDGKGGISWDELYGVKEKCGYRDREAVEIYPEADRLVNSADMRHLWVMPIGVRMAFGLDRERA